ncbi:hypothetical protein L3X38_026948 [Prunus dulcis]|uniref:Uncharacterized protein n=1 Tax=Prunus dulcis TaxID=3755 RepID=A0AAD4VNT9_PRUDU|nr:hypothetical protein L3X38_026948 [Prunus dulcis]
MLGLRLVLRQSLILEVLILRNDLEALGEDDWNYLVQLWQKDEWKKSSAENKENRKKLKITHCAGTKVFSRIKYENRNSETGEEPSRIDLFQLTRFSTKNLAAFDCVG